MANNWAIVIGINQYRFLQPLNYAKRDAKLMGAFLQNEARFDRIFLFTDDSPAIGGKSTEPFRANCYGYYARCLKSLSCRMVITSGSSLVGMAFPTMGRTT